MPGDDLEIRAFGCYILSRCIVASSEKQGQKIYKYNSETSHSDDMVAANAIREAIPFLKFSEQDYAALGMVRCQQDVLYLLASVYNTLGMTVERDMTTAKYAGCTKEIDNHADEEIPRNVFEIRSIITRVGAKIAAGSHTRR